MACLLMDSLKNLSDDIKPITVMRLPNFFFLSDLSAVSGRKKFLLALQKFKYIVWILVCLFYNWRFILAKRIHCFIA